MTEILFGNAPLANCETTILAADHRPAQLKYTDLDHMCSQFIVKREMVMRCMGMGGRKVGVKHCGVQGCCVGGMVVRSCWSMVKTVASTKTNRVGAAARQCYSAMSLISFFGIWNGRRENLPPSFASGPRPNEFLGFRTPNVITGLSGWLGKPELYTRGVDC